MEQIALDWARRHTYSVGELNAAIGQLLDGEFSDVWVAGEVSGVKEASSGHWYFTLKDAQAQLRCACYRSAARLLRFKPRDGMAVLARGRVDVYQQRGEYQLIVETIEPQGYGALQAAFEQLKQKLAAEGLFAPERKRPLPALPQRIGIVTSPDGAAISDMLQILERRFPGLHIRLYPAQVQGEGAVDAVRRGIDYFARTGWADVLIVGRGGGSLEDLWTFNEEAIARAIVASPIPVVSAVGHETDFTIADFVADLRAPTPSAAAELVVPAREQVLERIAGNASRLGRAMHLRMSRAAERLHRTGIERARRVVDRNLGRAQQRVDELEYRLRERLREGLVARRRLLADRETRLERRDLRLRFAETRRRLERASATASQAVRLRLTRARGRLDALAAHTLQLSPLKILDRGYAIVETEAGGIVKRAADAPPRSRIRVRLAQGRLKADVTESEP